MKIFAKEKYKEQTQAQLKELFLYDPETGILRWRKGRRGVRKNHIAGTLCPDGYIVIMINRKLYSAGKLIWLYIYGYVPIEVDHEDHNRSNNRLYNLRAVTCQENQKNQTLNSNNTTGHVGVYRHKRKWRSMIGVNMKVISLGFFEKLEDAVKARKAAEAKYGFHKNHGNNKILVNMEN